MNYRTFAIPAMLAATVLGVAGTAAAETKLRAVTFAQPNQSYPSMVMYKRFIERVNKAGKGLVQIDYIGGRSVIPTRDQMNATSKGIADMVMTFTIHQAIVPEIGSVGMSEISPAEERQVGFIELLDDAHKKINIKVLGRTATDVGFHVFSKQPITKVADFKNLKIRSHAGYDPVFKMVNASPIHMKISEIYTGLERGVVQAAPFPLTVTNLGLQEVICCAMSASFWSAHTTFSYINRGKFEKLPKEAQKLILDEQAELERYMGPKGKELKAGEIAKLKAAGIKFVDMSAEETKNWKNIANVARWNAVQKKLPPEQYAKIRKMITR
jgi:TRAP-type C4-dicarboxylate transport system substrate-binding protein